MIANIVVKGQKLFQKRELPNSDGFRFIGVDWEGNRFRCEVVKGHDGLHRVDGMEFKKMAGWCEQ